MSERARECAKCKFWIVHRDIGTPIGCDKGHRPRYYPQDCFTMHFNKAIHQRPAGYRRRCEDYDEREEGR